MIKETSSTLKIAIQQRVLPEYRAAFFVTLAGLCQGGLSLFAGQPLPGEGITSASKLEAASYTLAVNRYFFSTDSPLFLCWQSNVLQWLEHCQPEALIVEANPRILSTRRAVRWMHAHKKPVLGWGLGAPGLGGPLAGLRRLERQSFLGALDGWIAYSQRGAEQYRQLGLDARRIFVASNAVAARPTVQPQPRPQAFSGQPTLLFVGRLQRRKRLDLLLQACASLPDKPRLVIVGDGPDRGEIESQAQAVFPAAEFAGAQHGAALAAYFQAADLFVLPGTGGLAVQQAMAHGLPVVVAQGDGTQEDLVRPENGWLIPADNLAALTATLRNALDDPVGLRRMGNASYRIVAEEVNLEHMAEVFIASVRTVLALGLV